MNTDINKTLDELKTIVMALHRSAGQLDELITSIELETFGKEIDEYSIMYIRQLYENRARIKKHKGYSDLDEMEADIWARLLTDVKNEES